MEMTADQCRAARALLDWTQERLAAEAGVAADAVAAFESGAPLPQGRSIVGLRQALERGGICFIAEDGGGGPGVRHARRRGPPDEGLHPSQLTSENTD
jgi:transcriptional regulator with XRE-family HTH domain